MVQPILGAILWPTIAVAVALGIGIGFLLVLLYSHVPMRDSIRLTILLGVSVLLVFLEEFLAKWFSFSSLLSVLTIGIVLLLKVPEKANRIAKKCDRLWVPAEIFLFTLVGASLKLSSLGNVILPALLLIFSSLSFRSLGVQSCLFKTPYNAKERAYITLAYLPKATVQAALGGALLDVARTSGNEAMEKAGTVVLAVSVLYILITAPLSAFVMDLSYKHLLSQQKMGGTLTGAEGE